MYKKKVIAVLLAVMMIASVFVSVDFASATETVILDFDSTANFKNAYSTNLSTETSIKTQGTGSLKLSCTEPKKHMNASGVAGYTLYEFPQSQNLTSFDGFFIDVYFAQKMNGHNGLQVNFVTSKTTEDGFNLTIGVDDNEVGWHRFTIGKDSPLLQKINNPDWANINRLRILWTNSDKSMDSAVMYIDRLVGYTQAGYTPEQADDVLYLDTFDSLTGIKADFNTNVSLDSAQKTQGSSSMNIEAAKPTGQDSNIGFMARVDYKRSVDISRYKDIYLDFYVSQTFAPNEGGLQINFITDGRGSDGYNLMWGLEAEKVGWNTIHITTESLLSHEIAGTHNSLSDINSVRFTWFNYAQKSGITFKIDNFYATNGEAPASSGSSTESTSSTASASGASTPSGPVTETTIPYASDGTLMLHNFDSLNGISTAFNTSVSVDSETKEQGSGSVNMTANKPTGQASNIGAMIYVDFHKDINMASFKTLSLSYYNTVATTSGHQLQINFCSNKNGDGYNTIHVINDMGVGWHTITVNLDNERTKAPAKEASLYKINRLRITWFNLAQQADNMTFKLDNMYLGGQSAGSDVNAPSIVGSNLSIHEFDNTAGLVTDFNAEIAVDTTIKTSGTGSLKLTTKNPTGQSGKIAAMVTAYIAGGIDLTKYDYFNLDFYNSVKLSGSHGLQVSFGSSVQDGFNFMLGMDNFEPGWHNVQISKEKILAAKAVDYAYPELITNVRFTWFNYAQQADIGALFLDNFKLCSSGPTHNAYVADDNTLMLHDFEEILGVSGQNSTKVELSTDNVTQGEKSLLVTPQQPVGQSGNVGARYMVSFGSPVDFITDAYNNIHCDVHLDVDAGKGDKLEFSFISFPSGGNIFGFNKSISISGYTAGTYDFTFGRTSMMRVDTDAKWDNINAVCITWVNGAKADNGQKFYFDNLRALKKEPTESSESTSVDTSVETSIDTSVEPPKPAIKYGDVNDNGEVEAADALITLQCSIGKVSLDDAHRIIANVDGNEGITSSDALLILQRSIGKVDKFPVEDEPTPSDPSSESSSESSGEESSSDPESFVIPETIVENNAYTTDKTADTGFKITAEGLAKKTIYIVQSKTFQGTGTADDPHFSRYIYSLQGLINRDFGMDADHTCVLFTPKDASDNNWLRYIRSAGIYNGFAQKTINNWEAFCTEFAAQMKQCGMVLWDPNVPATANVAATVCGVDGYLPVLANSDLHKNLISKGIKENLNLNGVFTGSGKIYGTSLNSTGSTKNDAYRWAIAKYMDTNRCSSTYLAYTPDGALTIPTNPFSGLKNSGKNCISNMDYIIARRAFVFDLDPYKGDAACDDSCGIKGLDNQTMLQIFQKRYDRANGEFGQILGFPPWWVKYCSDTPGRNCGSVQSVWQEWLFCEYIAMYNIAKEADAADPTSMTNGSVFYKYRAVTEKFENNRPASIEGYNSNVRYYTIYMGDYDSSAWLKKYVYNFFTDPYHGKVNCMWAFNPNLSWRVPMIFDYVYQKKASTDYFTAGEGAGYLIPAGLFQGTTLGYAGTQRPNPDGGQKWADYNKKFYKLFDMDITGFIIAGNNAMTNNVMDCYNQFNTTGALMTGNNRYIRNGVPYIGIYNGLSDPQDCAGTMYNYMFSTMSRYNCVGYRTVNWSPSDINTCITLFDQYVKSKTGQTVKYVDPYTFFAMAKAANQF